MRTFSRRAAVGTGLAGLASAQPLAALARQSATPAPVAQGITAANVATAVDALDGIVADMLERTGVPGVAVAIVHQDETLATRGYGVRSTETGDPVDADTVFQLASLSKPVASTVVASIVADGLVTWDTPIVEHLPAFALHDPWATSQVTIRDMFSHRSGLPEHAGDRLEDMGFTREEVLHRLRYQPLATSFRSAYAYTNFGLTAGAVAASTAAGQEWEDASRERLYGPAGMTRTSSRFSEYEAEENRAHGHVLIDGAWVPRWVRQPDAQSPAGGVSSTATDMAQWVRLQLGGGTLDGVEIVPADALAETHVPHIVSSEPGHPVGFYGLGWNVSLGPQGTRYSHSGAFALGAGTTVTLLPEDAFGIVALANGAANGLAEAIMLAVIEVARTGALETDYLSLVVPSFEALMAPQYGQDVAGDPPADATPALDAAAYTGTYRNDFHGDIVIAADGDDLTLSQGPADAPETYPLTHWSRDTFTYLPEGENANVPSAVTFTIGADGAASRVWVENLDVHGLGDFPREEPAS